MNAGNGDCMGKIEASATIISPTELSFSDNDDCKLEFEIFEDRIEVTETGCNAYHDFNCGFHMKYYTYNPADNPAAMAAIREASSDPATSEDAAGSVVQEELDDTYFNSERMVINDGRYNAMTNEYYSDYTADPSKTFYFVAYDQAGNLHMVESDEQYNIGYQADPGRREFKYADATISGDGPVSAHLDMILPHPFGDGKLWEGHSFIFGFRLYDDAAPVSYSNYFLPETTDDLESDKAGLMRIEKVEMVEGLDVFKKPTTFQVITCSYVMKVAEQSSKEITYLYGKFRTKLK
jgi:hypothetical protein